MRKVIKRKKEIEVTEETVVCDLCGNIMGDDVFIRLQVTGKDDFGGDIREICSTDCLKRNHKGLEIQLNLKDIPTVRNNIKRYAEESKQKIDSYGSGELYDSAMKKKGW